MINLNTNQPYYNKRMKVNASRQTFTANTASQQSGGLNMEKAITNKWIGLSAIVFGLLGFVLPSFKGDNKEVAIKILTRNLPLAAIGVILGSLIGAQIGKSSYEKNQLLIQNAVSTQNSIKN